MFIYILAEQRVPGVAAGPGWTVLIITLKSLAPSLLAVCRLSTVAV